MRRELSSAMTPFYKIVFPFLWAPMFGVGAFVSVSQHWPQAPLFIGGWIIGSVFIYFTCFRLKKVELDEDGKALHISNFGQTITVPLSDITEVRENMWINIHPVYILLKNQTPFGQKIMFMPEIRILNWGSHPVVEELRKLSRS